MKTCALVFNTNVERKKSQLLKDLKEYLKSPQQADYVYDNIIRSNIYENNSFLRWLDSKRDFMTTNQGEPHIDEFIEWTKFLKKESQIKKTFSTNNVVTTVEEFDALSQGMTAYLPEILKNKKMTFNDISGANINNIRDGALKLLLSKTDEIIEDAKRDGDVEFADRTQLIRDEIANNKSLFFDAYQTYLESTLNLTIEATEANFGDTPILDETIQDNEEKYSKDTAFDKDATQFDQKSSAPKAIKLMIASLRKEEEGDYPQLPKLVNYNNTFNFIHQTLAHIPGDIKLYIEELNRHVYRKPELKQLIDQLNFYKPNYSISNNIEDALREQELRTQFVNQFDKTIYHYTLHIKDSDKNYKVIDSNLDRAQNIKLQEWENNFKERIADNPKIYNEEYFRTKIKNFSNSNLLKVLGIDSVNSGAFPTGIIDDIRKYGMTSFNSFMTIYDKKERKKGDVKSKLLKLAEFEVNQDDSIVELQHYNAEGNLVYGVSLNTYLSNKVKKLNYYRGQEDALRRELPEIYNDPYSRNSVFGEWVKQGDSIIIGISTGLKTDLKGKSEDTSTLQRRDITVQKIYSILKEGQYNFVRAADRKIENIFSFEGRRWREGLIVDGKNDMIMYLVNHLYDEIQANFLYTEFIDTKNIGYIDKNATRVFTLKSGQNLIKKLGLDNLVDLTPDDLIENDTVVEFIKKKIDEIIETEKQYLSKQGINKSDVSELLDEYGNYDTVIEQYALNAYAGNIEISKIFTGDPIIYGDAANFFKRMNMLNSTKESTRVDPEINSLINKLENNLERQHGYLDGRNDTTIRTITIEDVISNLKNYSKEEVDTFKKILGNINSYKEINEADGFAYITYDEYRIMKIRYNDWDSIDEELYQKITTDPNYVVDEKYYNRILPDKSQYVGKLYNSQIEGFNMVAGRKFSFMPLVPGLIPKGSVLDKLNQDMLSKGIGMAFMESAAKFGHKADKNNKPVHKLYDKDGNYSMDMDSGNIDILDYSGMGNQLRINKIPKPVQTESTQKRKLNISNFFENGVFKEAEDKEFEDKNLKSLLEEYDDIQKERLRRAYKTLRSRLGIDSELRKDKIISFVESITSMAKLQGFTTNELLALQSLLEVPFLDILPNKQRVENFIMAKLKNTVITQKRKGASMAQASNVGFELPGGLNRHDLKFYRLSKNGERLLPMEVYAPLPKELITYVSNLYNEGKGVSEESLEKFNKDIEEDNKIFEETGEMSTLTKITTFIGFRIPNQGASSSDVGKVKKFYMPHIGSMVVVPKAMVVKTGSDFDIDKLNMYLPDFRATSDSSYKEANKFVYKYMNISSIVRALKEESIGYDYAEQDDKTIKQWFIDNILEVDRNSLQNSRNKMYNDVYKDTLRANTEMSLEYIEPKGDIKNMSDRQLNNLTLENEIAITLSKRNWKQLLTPLGTDNIKAIVNSIRKLTNFIPESNLSDIFLGSRNTDKMIEFLSGKAGVGQTAVHNTNHILSQLSGLIMTNPHDYFKAVKKIPLTRRQVIKEEIEEEIPIFSTEKPEINIEFLDNNQIDNIKVKSEQRKLKKRKEELDNLINCIWKS